MNFDIAIRQALITDTGIIAEFNAAMALESEDRKLDVETLKNGVISVIEDERHGFYLLAEYNGEVIGQLMITYEWSDWRNGQFWWIQSVYINPEMRGRGVFTTLYRHTEEAAKKAGACGLRLYVEKDNSGAQKTYSKLGMSETAYRIHEVEFKS